MHKIISKFLLLCISLILSFQICLALPAQTDVAQAKHMTDNNGIPVQEIQGIKGQVYHPSGVAVYALHYAGVLTYDTTSLVQKDHRKFQACVKWLADNLKTYKNNLGVWLIDFDNTYNDSYIKAPWYSAFTQAVGIEALLASYELDGNKEHLELAKKAAEVLMLPLSENGLAFVQGEDIWFEEVPEPKENPTHILNGHMRALLALKKLSDITKDKKYETYYKKGLETLERWLPLYDSGYWLRYDLNPNKENLCFRFNNPYGYQLSQIPIGNITLRDPLSGEETIIVVGAENDANQKDKISGIDWGQPETIDQKPTRRLKSVWPASSQEENDGTLNHAPHTYFYLDLPGKIDNLRTQHYELIIKYKDIEKANINVQLRSIAPGAVFQTLRNSDLLLKGSNQWRTWKIPVRPEDLGYWVGQSYAEKHLVYLEILAKDLPALELWVNKALSYLNLHKPNFKCKLIRTHKHDLPKQTTILPVYTLDKKGVVRYHSQDKNTTFLKSGAWNGKGKIGKPVYSPFITAQQAIDPSYFDMSQHMDFEELHTNKYYYDGSVWLKNLKIQDIKRKPAYQWLTENAKPKDDALVWYFQFPNTYNDVVTEAPWQSSFGQSYVIKAFRKALDEQIIIPGINFLDLLTRACRAYNIPLSQGGIKASYLNNLAFFEEVPQAVHILNAHLSSLVTFDEVSKYVKEEFLKNLKKVGLKTLHHVYDKYDNGYWLRYDTNPKKEFLFQIDWISGEASPEIYEVILINPTTSEASHIEIDTLLGRDFKGPCKLSGNDWGQAKTSDGKNVRFFENGYKKRQKAPKGGTLHNVFMFMTLPNFSFDEYFEVPTHRLIIRYKDVSPGKFIIKTQSINEGNVLKFEPIPSGIWNCNGDQQWKEVHFNIQPQNMGWFVGPDYQKYHVEQLAEISKKYQDWFTGQQAEKHQYYYELNQKSLSPIIEKKMIDLSFRLDKRKTKKSFLLQIRDKVYMWFFKNNTNKKEEQLIDIASTSNILDSSPTYDGFGFDLIFKNKNGTAYAATKEDAPFPQFFTIAMPKETLLKVIEITWENEKNFGREYLIEFLDDNNVILHSQSVQLEGKHHIINLKDAKPTKYIRVKVLKAAGQNRILIRKIKLLKSK
ncbi:hypothetical protein IM40_00135 [Candidatus Paracaedimonas acanthamoebae]|nr:hypothetical protein IM40_00135 [Candidatus Paracaedimonas acanthamoebae]